MMVEEVENLERGERGERGERVENLEKDKLCGVALRERVALPLKKKEL